MCKLHFILSLPSWWLCKDLLFSGRCWPWLVAQHLLLSPHPKQTKMNKICLHVSNKFSRLISFGGLFVQAIGFGNDHVKQYGEGFHNHHVHAAMVMIFEAKGCVTWCPKRLQVEDNTFISRSMDERITMSSWCLHESQQKKIRYIWIFKRSMKFMFQRIMQQGNRRFLQVDMAESLMVARAEILDSKQCWSETAIAPSFRLRLRRMSTRWKANRGRNKVMMTIWRRWTWCQ
jgi:hypothetical protein